MFILSLPLVFSSGFVLEQVIEEGETQNLTVDGWDFEVELVMVSDQAKKAIFELNGEKSGILSEDDSYRFSDGSSILAREILIQEGGDGKDLVQYNLYSGKKGPAPVEESVEENLSLGSAVGPENQTLTSTPEGETPLVEEPEEVESSDTSHDADKKSLWQRLISWLKDIF